MLNIFAGMLWFPGVENVFMKYGRLGLVVVLLLVAAGCAMRPSWHWEKSGASEEQLVWDQNQCKAKVYVGSSGAVTNESVRRMFTCMEGKGWIKREN
jgi:hypothetical protein